jgi:exosortase A
VKLETEELLLNRVPPAAGASRGWGSAIGAIAVAIAAILLLYRETALSMVAIWGSSDTYAHGYLIAPLSLLLVWRNRPEVGKLVPAPDLLGFVLFAAAGFAWLVAAAGQVQVVQQYAMTAMIPAAVVAIAGRRVARELAFPLAFLLFAVPFGEAFLPRLMDWTANFTVGALRLTGIPVYREGTFFAIPSGQWSVVEACSGLRYLIASVTIGTLYACLTYQRLWKRLVFVAFSVLLPIGANFVRAYTVVMVGHLTNMKYAVGLDHIIYGWVFFGLVMVVFFWLGLFWRDPPAVSPKRHALLRPTSARPALVACAGLGVAALATAWPLYARYLDRIEEGSATLAAPAGTAGWTLQSEPVMHWRPHYGGAAASTLVVYRKGERSVAAYLGHYRNQRQGAELVGWQNTIAGGADSPWVRVGESLRAEDLTNGRVTVRQTRLRSAGGRLLVWDWYRIAGHDLSDPYLAKALLAREKLLGRGDASAAIVLAAPYDARPEPAAETLRLFIRDMLPAIDAALGEAAQGKPG